MPRITYLFSDDGETIMMTDDPALYLTIDGVVTTIKEGECFPSLGTLIRVLIENYDIVVIEKNDDSKNS